MLPFAPAFLKYLCDTYLKEKALHAGNASFINNVQGVLVFSAFLLNIYLMNLI